MFGYAEFLFFEAVIYLVFIIILLFLMLFTIFLQGRSQWRSFILSRRSPESVEADIQAGLERKRSCLKCGCQFTLAEDHKTDAKDIKEFLRSHRRVTSDILESDIMRLSKRHRYPLGLSFGIVRSYRYCAKCDLLGVVDAIEQVSKEH